MPYTLSMMENHILRINFLGNIGEDDVIQYLKEYTSYLDTANSDKPLHVVMDVSKVNKATSAARKAFGEIFNEVDQRSGKSAMIGANRYLRVLAGFVIKATGTELLRLFTTEEEAIDWLMN